MFGSMLERDRIGAGLTISQAARRLGVSPRKYQELETGGAWPSFETYDRICKMFGWPQTFTRGVERG
jgi:transcriptional regulator with XRE-family HTH domain